MKVKPAFGWAWVTEDGNGDGLHLGPLIGFTKRQIEARHRYSDEKKAIAVAVIPRADLRELKRKARLFDALQKGGPHAKCPAAVRQRQAVPQVRGE